MIEGGEGAVAALAVALAVAAPDHRCPARRGAARRGAARRSTELSGAGRELEIFLKTHNYQDVQGRVTVVSDKTLIYLPSQFLFLYCLCSTSTIL